MLQPILLFFFCQLIAIAYSFHSPFTPTGIHTTIVSRSSNSKQIKESTRTAMTTETLSTPMGAAPVGKKRPLRSIKTMIQDAGASSTSSTLTTSSSQNRKASLGDIVTIQLELTPENGYVPDHLFDTSGEVTFVLGWGNYLPGLHELLLTGDMSKGAEVKSVSIDAGFGRHNPEMVIEVPKKNFKKVQNIDKIVPNATLNLQGGIQVTVLEVTEDTIIVDANHPLAGSGYSCNLKILNIDPYPLGKLEFQDEDDDDGSKDDDKSPFQVATFAMGCFWGVELAFMRTPGVVGTRAGYTQGIVEDPSYEEIKDGTTGYREAVLVVYDSRVVSYQDILAVYNDRLAVTAPEYFKLDMFAEASDDDEKEPDSQYKHGLYFHNEAQKTLARAFIGSIKDSRYTDIELKPSAVFYSAEDHHQQYLYKGGQAARKGCRETIRCYG